MVPRSVAYATSGRSVTRAVNGEVAMAKVQISG
jgi:hypothetical protein